MRESRVTFTLNQVVTELNRRADGLLRAQFDITFSQFVFLLCVQRGRRSLTEVARDLDVTVAAVSKKVDWFRERGLVRTSADATHAKRVLIELTPKGLRLTAKTSETLDAKFVQMFPRGDSVDLTALNADLHAILEHLHSAVDKSSPSKENS